MRKAIRKRYAGLALGLLLVAGPVAGQGLTKEEARLIEEQLSRVAAEARFAIAQSKDRYSGAAERAEEERQRAADRKERESERAENLYERGQEALERAQWAKALEQFTALTVAGTARADAAMYWRAYAFDKLNRQSEALSAVAEMLKRFPSSRWLGDAKALEIQVRQRAGQPVSPEAAADEDLKLLAIQGLQHSDPAQSVPMLEKFLQGSQSPRLKERALFVLAQSNTPRARQVLTSIARGATNPDLQRKAIQYLGVNSSPDNRQVLNEIYSSSNDVEMKRQILQAFFVGGDAARLIEIATNEQNPDLRRAAVRQLGPMGSQRTSDALVTIYTRQTDPDIKRAAIEGLFIQNNAEALVSLARKESDRELQRRIVQQLSLMQSKVAIDYMMELLNK